MDKEQFTKMSNTELVAWAMSKGIRVRGMNRKAILEQIDIYHKDVRELELTEPGGVIYKKSGKKGKLIPVEVEDVLNPPEPEEPEVKLSWNELKTLAKGRGIQIHGKTREELEAELKEPNNG